MLNTAPPISIIIIEYKKHPAILAIFDSLLTIGIFDLIFKKFVHNNQINNNVVAKVMFPGKDSLTLSRSTNIPAIKNP